MSQSPAAVGVPPETRRADDRAVIDGDDAVQTVLGALTDEDCRAILEAIGDDDDRLTATELSETCDVPLSTTYRKLERLTDAGLLEERLRIRRSGNHVAEYDRRVDDVRIAVDSDVALELHVTERESSERARRPERADRR